MVTKTTSRAKRIKNSKRLIARRKEEQRFIEAAGVSDGELSRALTKLLSSLKLGGKRLKKSRLIKKGYRSLDNCFKYVLKQFDKINDEYRRSTRLLEKERLRQEYVCPACGAGWVYELGHEEKHQKIISFSCHSRKENDIFKQSDVCEKLHGRFQKNTCS